MPIDQVAQYLRENQQYPREQLREQLLKAGYPEIDITAAWAQIDAETNLVSRTEIISGGKLPGTRTLINETWTLFIAKWKLYLGIALVPFAGVLGLVLVMTPVIGSFAGARFLGGAAAPALNWFGGIGMLLMVVVGFPLLIILQLWGMTALWYAASCGSGQITFKQAFGESRRMILRLAWVNLLMGGIVLGGLAFLVVPGIIFAIWFVFAGQVLFIDGDRGMSALFKSREYVRGYVFPVFGRLFLFGLVGTGLGFIFVIAVSFIGGSGEWLGAGARMTFNFVWTMLSVIYGFVLFRHVRVRRGAVTVDTSRGRKAKYAALIGLGIIGTLIITLVLPVIMFVGLDSARDRGRDAKRLADLEAVRLALETYAYQNDGVYPSVPAAPEVGPSNTTFNTLVAVLVEEGLISGVPIDPSDERAYVAQLDLADNATSYILAADLETNQAVCGADYDGGDLEEPDIVPRAVCGEAVDGECAGAEVDNVDFCICVGLACD